jgi:hypothetical protein
MMIQADEQLLERAKDEARRRGISFAQLVRDALARELGQSRRPRTKLIGAFDSGGMDLARRSVEEEPTPTPPWR